MGLAPYGEPRYADLILKELVDLKDDGSFRLNMKYFDYCVGLTMTNDRFETLFGGPPRKPESKLTQRDMDLARSIQEVTEEILFRMARHVRKETGQRNLCLAGGVALNCVANGRILRERLFDRLWIQPAAGDAGGALGARSILGDARSPRMQEVMNLKIKFRESFRPFAPSVLRERVSEYFELEEESPYMLLVAPVAGSIRREMTAKEQRLFGLEKL